MKILYILVAFAFFSVVVSPAFASDTPNCQQIYGGGSSCNQTPPIVINKQVQNSQSKAYVDSLTPDDPQYTAGQTVPFKITITNTGTAAVNFLTITDFFPPYIDYSKGQGKYDAKNRSLQFMVDQLKSNESKVFVIDGKVAAYAALPDSQSARCVINRIQATANGNVSEDNTLVCLGKQAAAPITTPTTEPTTEPAIAANTNTVTKGGLPIYPPSQTKSTPSTGPEAWALFALAPISGLGFFLRRKANRG
jgi:uncharacterized repeat protein (TIGR01451 family)